MKMFGKHRNIVSLAGACKKDVKNCTEVQCWFAVFTENYVALLLCVACVDCQLPPAMAMMKFSTPCQYYILMELCSKGTLMDMITRQNGKKVCILVTQFSSSATTSHLLSASAPSSKLLKRPQYYHGSCSSQRSIFAPFSRKFARPSGYCTGTSHTNSC